MWLIFRGKFKTSVSSSPSALLWQLLLLLLLKPLLTLAYSEIESNLCLQRQLEKLDVFSVWWMNSTTLSSLTRMQMIPPSAYYISPLHEKVLQRGSTPTKDNSCFLFGILSVFFRAWASWFNILAMLATRTPWKSGKLRGWNFEQILRYTWGNLRWNHGCPDSVVKMHCFGSFHTDSYSKSPSRKHLSMRAVWCGGGNFVSIDSFFKMFDNFSHVLYCGVGDFRWSLGKVIHSGQKGAFSMVRGCMRRHLEPENELQSVSFCWLDFHIRESNGEWSDCRLSSRWISSDDGEMDWNWHAGRLHAVIMPTCLSSYLCLFDSNLTS